MTKLSVEEIRWNHYNCEKIRKQGETKMTGIKEDVRIGTLWMHTSKAIARGEPAERLFAVVAVDGPYLIAWKHDLRSDGRVYHIGRQEVMSRDDPRLFESRSPNGASASAMFRPDSLYRKC